MMIKGSKYNWDGATGYENTYLHSSEFQGKRGFTHVHQLKLHLH